MSKTAQHSTGQFKVDIFNYPKATPPRKELVIVNGKNRLAIVDWAGIEENPFTIPDAEARANAALFAAAPELLAACKFALDSIIAVNGITNYKAIQTKLAAPAFHLKAAIEKAIAKTDI